MKLIVVYSSISYVEKTTTVKTEISELIEMSKEQPILMNGDFHGHVGFLGERTLDRSGQMMIDWTEKDNLILLNDDVKCDGLYTWKRQDQKSVIGYSLCNQQLRTSFISTKSDQHQEDIDISDYNLLDICFSMTKKNKEKSGRILYHKRGRLKKKMQRIWSVCCKVKQCIVCI